MMVALRSTQPQPKNPQNLFLERNYCSLLVFNPLAAHPATRSLTYRLLAIQPRLPRRPRWLWHASPDHAIPRTAGLLLIRKDLRSSDSARSGDLRRTR